ncbi:MAG: TraR/DksA C4-type zinc finger protein [Acidimicrobiales bacterium]|jgi:DnaK suppressor protein
MATTTSPTTAANSSAKHSPAPARKAAPKQVEEHDSGPRRKAARASASSKGAVVTDAGASKSAKAPAEKAAKAAVKVAGPVAKTAATPSKAARSHGAASTTTKAAGAGTKVVKSTKAPETPEPAKTPARAAKSHAPAPTSASKAAAAAPKASKASKAAPAGKAAAKDQSTKDHTTNAKDSAVKDQPAKKATATKEAHAAKAAPVAPVPAAAHVHAPNHVPSSPRTGTGLLSSRRRDLPVKRTEGYTEERFLAHQRHALDSERATYLEQAKSLRAEAESLVEEMEPGDIQFDDESGEGGTVTVDRERDLALSAQALVAVDEIDHAIHKMAMHTYGICENCGRLVPKARLEALPYARLCIDCKSGGLSRR